MTGARRFSTGEPAVSSRSIASISLFIGVNGAAAGFVAVAVTVGAPFVLQRPLPSGSVTAWAPGTGWLPRLRPCRP
jgi:hypothetical protein